MDPDEASITYCVVCSTSAHAQPNVIMKIISRCGNWKGLFSKTLAPIDIESSISTGVFSHKLIPLYIYSSKMIWFRSIWPYSDLDPWLVSRIHLDYLIAGSWRAWPLDHHFYPGRRCQYSAYMSDHPLQCEERKNHMHHNVFNVRTDLSRKPPWWTS